MEHADGSGGATVRQAAILVGGLGSRLGAATARTPKPILPCGDRPFLAWLIRELVRFGIEEVVLLAGHLSPVLEAALPGIEATLPRPVRISISVEPVQAGTGGALHHARDLLDERFLLCNGDSILDFNLARLLSACAGRRRAGIVLRAVADTDRFGVVRTEDGRVSSFEPRSAAAGPGLVNAGIYLFERGMLEGIPAIASLEADVLPRLAASGALAAVVSDGWFIDIGVPEDLARAQAELPARFHRPALLLDRDGTINRDHGWVGRRDRWDWMDGARETIVQATDAGWHVFVVTNQSGIARGLYDEGDFLALHRWVADEVRKAGGTIDDVRYCPFHPEGGVERYRRASDWRKPGPGMVLDLIRAWELDPSRAIMVGDQPTDLAAATAAGIASRRFGGGNLRDLVAPILA